jgi:hypothetical protein
MARETAMNVNYSNCESCGVELAWAHDLDRRPLESKPCARRDGEPGYVIVRRSGKPVVEPSVDHPNAPEHFRVHVCYAWLTERRDRVASVGELLNWSERADRHRQEQQRPKRKQWL